MATTSPSRFVKVDGGFERIVQPGDTLGALARERGLTLSDLLQQNPQFRSNPDLIYPGQRVFVPGSVSESPVQTALPGAGTNTQGTGSVPSPYGSAAPVAPASTANPADNFNLLLNDALKKAQGVNTDELLKRRRELLRRQYNSKATTFSSDESKGLSPAQQDAIRSGETQAFSPEIDENAYELKKAETAINNFQDLFTKAQTFGADFAEKMVAPENVVASAVKLIEADPDRLATVLAAFNDKTKQEILSNIDYTAIKAAATTKKEPRHIFCVTSDNAIAAIQEMIEQLDQLTAAERRPF